MSSSNIDNLMLKFAMSRLKAGAMVPPMAYNPSPMAKAIDTPEQQRIYDRTVSQAPRFPGPAGYDQNGFFANTGTVNPDGSFNTTQYNNQGTYSGLNPLSSAGWDGPITGDSGSGLYGALATGGVVGGGATLAARIAANVPFIPYRNKDISTWPADIREEFLTRNIRDGATDVTIDRANRNGSQVLHGSSARAMAQSARIPQDPASYFKDGKPGPVTLTQTTQNGKNRAVSTTELKPRLLSNLPPRPGSQGGRVGNAIKANPGRFGLAAAAAAAGIPYVSQLFNNDRREPGMDEGVSRLIPPAPAMAQPRTITGTQ